MSSNPAAHHLSGSVTEAAVVLDSGINHVIYYLSPPTQNWHVYAPGDPITVVLYGAERKSPEI